MITERPRPYIGISGVVNTEQQTRLLDHFASEGLSKERLLALGVKATHNTQYLDQENKHGSEWYPVGESVFAQALEPSANSLNVAQVFFNPADVKDAEYKQEFIGRIRRRGAKWLDAIQFDLLPWHEDEALLTFVEQIKYETDFKILLQAHGESMRELGPKGVIRALGSYAHALDYVLFDSSHGQGVRLDTDVLIPFLDAAYGSDELQSVGFAVAGGLNSKIVTEDLPELVRRYPGLSWDAEGQLHPVNSRGTRPLDIAAANSYITAAAEVLRRV